MDEIRLAPHAMTAEELWPIVWRRQFRIYAIMWLAYACIVGNVFFWALGSLIAWLALPVLFAGSMLVYRFRTLPRQIRKADPLTFASRDVVLTDAGISWDYVGGLHTTLPWTLVRKAEVYRGIYLLFLPGGNYFVLPRRALDNDQEHYLVDRLRDVKLLP